ncbi:MAG TPA: copper homeostasis membrane protein CopD [Caldimonas sp.]|nr:copper homeostasis membrane protein CopD [Caldimonas sp.]HEX4233799.1 copper homeostasis membrane protein CopD [Caldimonas sp.]
MEALFVIVRAVHIGALVALTGVLVFAIAIAGASPSSHDTVDGGSNRTWQRLSTLWLLLAIASGLAWLGLEAAAMSGQPLQRALGRQTLGTVIAETDFGQVWLARTVLSVVLAAFLAVASRRPAPTARRAVLALCTIVAAALLASVALVGHANAEHGGQRGIHLAADAVHLLAAGAWLGTLVPLVALLGRSGAASDGQELDAVADAVHRFSLLGVLAVSALVVTGIINASFTVATISALLTTDYGHLLLLKLALVGGMLALAANNRTRLTPSLADTALAFSARAAVLARLRRSAMVEVAFGLAILAVVGVLGRTMPASHASAMAPTMQMR